MLRMRVADGLNAGIGHAPTPRLGKVVSDEVLLDGLGMDAVKGVNDLSAGLALSMVRTFAASNIRNELSKARHNGSRHG